MMREKIKNFFRLIMKKIYMILDASDFDKKHSGCH